MGDIEHLDEWARDNPDDPILDLEDLMAQAQDLAAEQGHIPDARVHGSW
jgi:hypothetical protein